MATPIRYRLSDPNDDIEVFISDDGDTLGILSTDNDAELYMTWDGVAEFIASIQQLVKAAK